MLLDIKSKVSQIFYRSGDDWKHLPDWAAFYLELGVAISDYEQKGIRFILGVSVPTRSFAAPLISAGTIAARIGKFGDVETSIKKVTALPDNTTLIYRTKGIGYQAYYKGCVERMGEKYFALKTAIGTERYVPINNANQIEIIGNKSFKLHYSHKGVPLPKPSLLVEQLLCHQDLEKLMCVSNLECVLLGQLNTLMEEIDKTILAYSCNKNQFNQGSLQDLVRPKRSNNSHKFSYRSLVFPASGKYPLLFSSKFSPFMTIFDNALAFIKWRNSWRHSNWVVILDRTDRNFDYAINIFNDEYISQKRLSRKVKLPLPKPPKGVELMVFEVAG